MPRASRMPCRGPAGVAFLLLGAAAAVPGGAAAQTAPVAAPLRAVAAAREGPPGQWAPRGAPGFPPAPKRCLELPVADRCACLEWLGQDWAGTRRYAAANARLPPARRGERRVVFFGDSITDNWSQPGSAGFFPGRPYVNRGIGSQSTSQMLVRFRRDVVALAPAVVVILAGTNDVSGNSGPTPPAVTARNLATMTELARLAGIRVVLATLLPVRDGLPGGDGKPVMRTAERPLARIAALNRWIVTFARENGLVLLDYHAALADETGQLRAGMSRDGVHPGQAGYAVMAPLAEKAIAAALKARPLPAAARGMKPVVVPPVDELPADSHDDTTPRVRLSPRGCNALATAEQRCACLAVVLRNWGGLDRHAAANAAEAGADEAMRASAVFFGESMIAAWAQQPGGFFPGKAYLPRGVEWQTTDQMLLRFRQDVLELRPRAVVIAPGLGDLIGETGRKSLAEIQDNLEAMSALARLHGIAVVLAGFPPASDGKRRPDGRRAFHSGELPPAHIAALNVWLAAHAARHGDVYLDWHRALADPSGQLADQLTDDGLLPNAAGFNAMTPLAEEAVSAARAGKPR